MQIQNFVLFFGAFIGLWYGSGLIFSSTRSLSARIKMPSFVFSFFVLGLLTSIPEIAVGVNALSENRPEVFVGNILGSAIVMFLLAIPLLAIVNKRVPIKKHLDNKGMLVTLGVIAAPAFFTLDKTLTNTEGFILIALYVALFYVIRTKQNVVGQLQKAIKKDRKDFVHGSIIKLILGVVVVFATSRFIVEQTIELSEFYGISTFVVSLVLLGIGTNIPEITLALRSVTHKAEDIALGDYLGSAATNSMVFGVLVIFNKGDIITQKDFTITFLIIIFSLGMFYMMTRGKSELTRKEGFALLSCYLVFLAYEFMQIG